MIAELKPTERFVFGSNIRGEHAGGAARQAYEQFGAAWGVGEGLTGQCYAFPTLNAGMQQYDHVEMVSIRAAFYRCARAHPEMTFLLTKVGCGIASYSEDYMRELFATPPTNVVLPEEWR